MDIDEGTTYSITIAKPAGKNYAKARKHHDWLVGQVVALGADRDRNGWVINTADLGLHVAKLQDLADRDEITVTEYVERPTVDRW